MPTFGALLTSLVWFWLQSADRCVGSMFGVVLSLEKNVSESTGLIGSGEAVGELLLLTASCRDNTLRPPGRGDPGLAKARGSGPKSDVAMLLSDGKKSP